MTFTVTDDGVGNLSDSETITITGNGPDHTIIQADVLSKTATYRVFQVDSPGNLTLDNYGDAETGRQRLRAGADLVNPGGRGDVLRLQGLPDRLQGRTCRQ